MKTPVRPRLILIPALLALLAFVPVAVGQAPATSKPADTKQEEAKPVQTDLLAGNWCGYWVSCKNGHNGKLKATFCRLNKCQVQAVFVGSFAKILPFRYKATLDVVHEEKGMIHLRGSHRLGPIMGTFTYEGTITADAFRATYRSKRDCGQWNMDRVECPCQ